jgi:hypothetical protein
MITNTEKSILLNKISVLLQIGYTAEEVTSYVHNDTETLNSISSTDQRAWEHDRIIHQADPYHSLHRMGLLNSFDLIALGNSNKRGEDAENLSQYYLWDEENGSRYSSYDDAYFALRYIYRYWLTTASGSINPVEPTLGEPGLEKMFGIPLRNAFRGIVLFESKEQYVETIRSASILDRLCMTVIEHGILRETLHDDLGVLLKHLKRQ